MAFNDSYRESIQSKHIANVGFTSTAKGVTNEGNALANPHQVLASQIPAIDVVNVHGELVADGISAGLVEQHTIKLTADPTVNSNKAWFATEDQCTEAGHSARGVIRVAQWMRYAETQYKLRLFEDNGAGAIDMSAEILPSEGAFNWEYDASAGLIYFDADPSVAGKITPLWGLIYTYVGDNVQDGLGATSSGVEDLVNLFDDTNEPTGFVDRVSSTVSFDDGTRTLTVSGTEFSYYIEGEKYTKTGAQSKAITDSEGMHYVYFDDDTLTSSQVWSSDIIMLHAFVAAIYWDVDNSTGIQVGDERHGITMDGQTHAYLHSAFGTQYIDGLALEDITSNGNGTSNAHATLSNAAGNIRDEDILISVAAESSPATIPVFYKNGAAGDWRKLVANDYPLVDNHSGATLPKYNQWTGSTWQLTELVNDNLVLSHIFATNDIYDPVIAIAGQSVYNSVASARDGANEEINNLILTGMPFAEFIPIGTVIYMANSAYSNTPKARIITDAEGNDYVDWRLSGYSPNPQSVAAHANLTGRDVVNSHPAAAIAADTSSFEGALSIADQTVQAALETLDYAVDTNASGIADNVEAIIWEVVDSPSDQIRPKIVHQGKAIYSAGNLTIGGDLTVSGTTTTVHSDELTVADKVITVNAGEAGAGITGSQYAGIEVDRGAETDYMFVFDEVQDNFRVGISGSLQAVATREDVPVDNRVPWWDESSYTYRNQGTTYFELDQTNGQFMLMSSGTKSMYLDDDYLLFGQNDASVNGLYWGRSDDSFTLRADSRDIISTNTDSATFAADGNSFLSIYDDTTHQIILKSYDGVTPVIVFSYGVGSEGDALRLRSDTNTYLNIGLDTDPSMAFTSSGTAVFTVNSADGMSLETGTSVNEILSSADGIDASSTDDQLATAKAIFANLGSTALSGTPTYMYYVGPDGNIAETEHMIYDTVTNDTDHPQIRIGKDQKSNLEIDNWSNRVRLNSGAVTILEGSATFTTFGIDNDTNILLEYAQKTIDFVADDVKEMEVNTDGMKLKTGTSVNEILSSVDGLSAASTDDQLATAKLIYDELGEAVTSSGTATHMYYVGEDGHAATTSGALWLEDEGMIINQGMALGNLAEEIAYGPSFPTYGIAMKIEQDFDSGVTGAGNGLSVYVDNAGEDPWVTTMAVNAVAQVGNSAQHYQIVGVNGFGNYTHTGGEVLEGVYGVIGAASAPADNATIENMIGGDFRTGTGFGMVGLSVTNMAAIKAEMFWSGSGDINVTNGYGVLIETPAGSTTGSGINLYGMYVEDQSASGFINDYNIYSAGASSVNYFEGKIQAGALEFPAKSSAVIDEVLNVADGDTIDGSSTDAQLASAKLIYNTISGVESTLDEAIIWEVVDTPTEQIRPRVEHQGKAMYSAGNLTIGGDLTVSGTTTTVHSEELTVADKVITVNAGEAGAGITGSQYAGIEVDRGSETDYMFVFDEVQDNFRVGISGSLQAVATREDSPIDMRVPYWNDSNVRFDTSGTTYMTINSGSGGIEISADGAIDIGSYNSGNPYIWLEKDAGAYVRNSADDTGIFISDTDTRIQFSANSQLQMVIDENGMNMGGNSVNDILVSTDSLSAASTDAQLATAKLIYNELESVTTTSGSLDHALLDNLDYASSGHTGFSPTHSHPYSLNTHLHDDRYYTESELDAMFAGLTAEFIELTDVEVGSYTAGRVLFTTASGVVDNAAFSFDSGTETFSTTAITLGTGGSVNEVVGTVTSGTTDSQVPTAKAVWDLTEAAAAAVHTHYDVDGVYVSDTSWTYETGFSANPDDLQIYVNGVKQRIGGAYDCEVATVSGTFTATFNYNVYTTDWVNINYTA